ncbi:hypothetical protein FH972_024725 [Carpinus fangiana]|uniref:Aminoglycoside phosphotransferase domain-containing protein n=1 Tax=Carpinus fangiana TaxID=176857 RepID=A0A5N6KZ78_9ROSI|nr:hypothetical protein FH972_024725 [Carpinus fangiana]
MDPEIKDSVKQTSQTTWALGSSIICEKNAASPINSIQSWIDGSDRWDLRRKKSDEVHTACDRTDVDMIHAAGTSAAVWSIGTSVICKVKSWIEGLQSESDTITFAKAMLSPHMVPDVLHTWVDSALDRSFTVERRVIGTTLDVAWPSLSGLQKTAIASEVAACCHILAQTTSRSFETVHHRGIVESFLGSRDFYSPEPSWKPFLLPVLPPTEFQSFTAAYFQGQYPLVDEGFVFYHADLGPGNIMVHNGLLRGIIDWESAGFYPRWWISLKPKLSAGFLLSPGVATDRKEWVKLLTGELEMLDYKPPSTQYTRKTI